MPATIDALLENNILILRVQGSFDFNLLNTFKHSYEKICPKPEKVIINLEKCNQLDSSALGMLVALWDYFGRDRNKLKLVNVINPNIIVILKQVKLDELLQIEY